VADFETTSLKTYELVGETYVWAACLMEIDNTDNYVIENNIDDFMKHFGNESKAVYFHNLKFDGEFIISYLLQNGWSYSNKKNVKTFNTIISDTGQWYSIELIHKKFNKRYVKTIFYDSLKKIPLAVRDVAKTFNLGDSKGIIDYEKHRERNHIITDEEKDYIYHDCLIMAKALKIQFDEGLNKMTISSDSLNYYKTLIGGRKPFSYLYPTLTIDVDNDIRKAYKGGYVYLNPKYINKRLKGVSYDVNSLYPYVMRYKMLPYTRPKTFEGKYEYDYRYPLYIVKFSCYFKLKEGKLPTIQLKGNRMFCETEYIVESNDIVDLTLTNVDLELFLEHYDVSNIEWFGGYKFRGSKLLFDDYIDILNDIKTHSTGGTRYIAKMRMNSLYGKFATNPKKAVKQPYLDEYEIVRYETQEEEIGNPVYTALGAFITSYAREKTIRAAQANYDRFIYADTDSIHLVGYEEGKGIEIDSNKLGCWKNEGQFQDSLFLRPKTYIKNKEGNLYVTCAGMPETVKNDVTFDNFNYGTRFEGKLLPKRVKGGIILAPTDYTIKS
jgi:hypothetical protein